MDKIVLISVFVSLIVTIIFLPYWIKKTKQVGLMWDDMNKINRPKVSASGGIIVIMAFVLSVLTYLAIRTFFISEDGISLNIFSLLSVVLILAIVGLTDDLLGWKLGGLSARFRIFLVLMAGIPLVVINAGEHTINLPFVGIVELGIIYPLILIPIGIVGATTTYNFLAGFNGLESSQGIIILSFLSFVAYETGSSWLALVGLCMVASLIVFYFFNKYPAKVFPGDILTYSIGALIAIMAILGNFEKVAIFVFIPYIIETVLKLRGGLKKQSFGLPQNDGSLELPYDKIYGLEHLAIKILKKMKRSGKVYEKDVVYLINSFQIFIVLICLIIFKESILII
ncbi:MAG: glycosyl transferase family 4 [Nanoarchaeota archaeon]